MSPVGARPRSSAAPAMIQPTGLRGRLPISSAPIAANIPKPTQSTTPSTGSRPGARAAGRARGTRRRRRRRPGDRPGHHPRDPDRPGPARPTPCGARPRPCRWSPVSSSSGVRTMRAGRGGVNGGPHRAARPSGPAGRGQRTRRAPGGVTERRAEQHPGDPGGHGHARPRSRRRPPGRRRCRGADADAEGQGEDEQPARRRGTARPGRRRRTMMP